MKNMIMDISFDSYLELEKICIGAFYPLTGFMTEEEFNSVIKKMRLPDGQIFPIPVILPISEKHLDQITLNKKVYLYHENKKVGSLIVKSLFKPNFQKSIEALFGTKDRKHPGYQMLLSQGKNFVGGPVKLFKKMKNIYSNFDITPEKVKEKIKNLDLKSIAGFQTRNVPHRAHEHILYLALKEVDGLFIQPLIGKKRVGDFTPHAIINSYNLLIKKHLPKKKIILGALTTSMRYAGPREAVFHAIIRKNYGCTHFIVGRDHAGVSNYYGEYEAQNLCIKLEKELNIKIIKMRGPFFCNKCDMITTDNDCKHIKDRVSISGTKIRDSLKKNKPIDTKFMRPDVINVIRKEEVFIKNDDK